ncbi:hypothetical protein BGZ63DRAFT_399500 [Mariannaea sp. PMI_226]|nr:hypothetical protein BGZ63DRAFT_399500 [Mariannaea sp. PMI_226]
MATCPIPIRFHCEGVPEELAYTYQLPRRLIRSAAAIENDPSYKELFSDVIGPIIREHEAACRAASTGSCGRCGCSTSEILQLPINWLHRPDPIVEIVVLSVCERQECKRWLQDELEAAMEQAFLKSFRAAFGLDTR